MVSGMLWSWIMVNVRKVSLVYETLDIYNTELTTKYFSIGDNSNLSHAATKTTHTKLFKPYLFIEPP